MEELLKKYKNADDVKVRNEDCISFNKFTTL